MMSATGTAAFATLPKNGVYAVIFNTAIAAILAAVGYGGGFFVNFIHSQLIGMTAWLLCDGGQRLLWPNRKPPLFRFVLLLAASVLLAALTGTWLGSMLFGYPWRVQSTVTSLLIATAAGFIAALYFWERERAAAHEAEAAHEKSRAEAIGRQAAQAHLKLLQAQIEPHFLFNTLANLHALIPADPARAQQMLDHLNGFLRAALAAARKERNTLADEFALLRDYLEILAIRMDTRLRYRLELPAELEGIVLPPMLLQPLVENSIKHGLEPKLDGGEVTVSARAEGAKLVLAVDDTGLGLGAADTGGSGAGIAQVRERLASIYGDGAALELAQNRAGGASATLRLPLER